MLFILLLLVLNAQLKILCSVQGHEICARIMNIITISIQDTVLVTPFVKVPGLHHLRKIKCTWCHEFMNSLCLFVGYLLKSYLFITRTAVRNTINQKIKDEKKACKRKKNSDRELINTRQWLHTVYTRLLELPVTIFIHTVIY